MSQPDKVGYHETLGFPTLIEDSHSAILGLRLLRNREVFGLDFEPQSVVRAHVNIRDPHQSELRDNKAPPPGIEHLKVGQHQEQPRYVVAEAILARKQVEKLALVKPLAVLASILTELPGLPKNLFMRDRPGDTGDGKAEKQKRTELMRQGLIEKFWRHCNLTSVGCSDDMGLDAESMFDESEPRKPTQHRQGRKQRSQPRLTLRCLGAIETIVEREQ